MNKGKITCEALKAIRQQVADANGIPYTPCECSFEGECSGTCPNCERERQYIESQLSKKHSAGKALKIIGVAASVTAMLASPEVKAQEYFTPDSLDKKEFKWDYYDWQLSGVVGPSKEAKEILEEMSEFVSLFPHDTFMVVGHTDERGSLKYNLKISQKKAEYFRSLLINNGVNPSNIYFYGAGPLELRFPNAQNEEEHGHNRRTTIEFYSKERAQEIEDKIEKKKK